MWSANLTGTGLIVPPYSSGDDPEIYFNNKTILERELGVIFDGNPSSTIERAFMSVENAKKYYSELDRKYDGKDGIDIAAKIICDYLGK